MWKTFGFTLKLSTDFLLISFYLCLSCCKTQNSVLLSKEQKPSDPINQPSRCNTQEGLLSFAQTGDSDLLGGRAHRTANWASFICNILHTGCKVIGYTFAKQSYWYKLRGLHVYKAILLAQTSAGFCSNLKQFCWYKRRGLFSNLGARGLFTGCILIGRLQVTRWGRGIPPFHGNRNPIPGPLPAPAPAAPHNKTYFSASKTNKKNIRHMNYRHW